MARLSPKTPEEEEAFAHGFYNLPLPKEREKMSIIQLAEILANCKENSLPYIVVSHELNMKIAKEQSGATINAGWIAAIAAVTSAIVNVYFGYLLSSRQPVQPHQCVEYKPPCTIAHEKPNTEQPTKVLPTPRVVIPEPPVVKVDNPGSDKDRKEKE